MASAKIAIGTVLGTITDAAAGVSSLINTGISGIEMLNRYVASASEKQGIDTDYDLAGYEDRVASELVLEETKRAKAISSFFNESPDNRGLYEAAHQRIGTAVAARRAHRANPEA